MNHHLTKSSSRIATACLLACTSITAGATLSVYPTSNPGMYHNDDYTVKVRTIGGEWQDLFEYKVQVDMDKPQDASMVQFDMDEPIEVMVKKNNGIFSQVDIRPLKNGIKYERHGNVITFRMDEPKYLSVEFDGDRLHNLHLFANPVETEVYTESKGNVLYFGPGVHKPADLPNNQIRINSNTTVYIAPGAVIRAKLLIDNAENVRILGRGILDHPIRGIEITNSKNVEIDGVTVVNPDHYSVFGGGSSDIKIRNLKAFSIKGWSDGIDLMCCRNVDIDNVFMRNSDDCIALYNHRWHWKGGSSDITVRNSVLWADIAHPINIGGHGDPDNEKGEIIERLRFENIDILEHDEDDPPYRGAMCVVVGDNNIAQDITFDDIRVESIQEGVLFHLEVQFNRKYSKVPGQTIRNVTFRNITYNGYGESKSEILGYDANRRVSDITFIDVMVNGTKLTNLDDFVTNDYIDDIKFK